MNFRRMQAAGLVHNKSFVIFGGYESDGSGRLQSTEIITEEGQVSTGPDMPTAVSSHAIAAVNATTSIITGGQTNHGSSGVHSSLTWYFNHVTQKFQSGPSLTIGRHSHASGTIIDQETKEEIVAVFGGYNGGGNNSGTIDSTELLLDGEWQEGKNHTKRTKCFLPL